MAGEVGLDEIDHLAGETSHWEHAVDSQPAEGFNIAVGNGTADQQHHAAVAAIFCQPLALQRIDQAGDEPHVRSGQDADANDVHVFLGGGSGNLIGGYAHPQVHDLHASVAEGAGDDLDAAVVAVQTKFGEQNAGGRIIFRRHDTTGYFEIIQSPDGDSVSDRPRLGTNLFRDSMVGALL